VLVAAPALVFGWRFNPLQPRPRLGTSAIERVLRAEAGGGRIARVMAGNEPALPANLLQPLHLEDVHGASAAGLRAYFDLARAVEPDALVGEKYLGVTLIVSDRELALPLASPLEVAGLRVFRNPGARPRFWIAPPDDPASVAAGAVEVVRREVHEVVLRTSASTGGLLVSSEPAYPGWTSAVDGVETTTLRVNGAFRAVAVPAGEHEVRMRFVPRSFHVGLAVSGLALAAWGIAAWRGRW
jgi:hypothetical protein